MTGRRRSLVVAGHGMVGHKLVQAVLERDGGRGWDITVLGEEPRAAYDRVHLSALFDGAAVEDLALVGVERSHPAVRIHTGERVVSVDREARIIATASGRRYPYDALVLATGSVPWVPPVPGRELPGCFVYRTVEDVEAIKNWAATARRGVVVGGGLLGLEAANALRCCGVQTTVVEVAPRLMPAQVDETGGSVLGDHIRRLGVEVRTSTTVRSIAAGGAGGDGGDGRVGRVTLAAAKQGPGRSPGSGPDATPHEEDLDAQLVVFSAGVRPRDELARSCGLPVGQRGGVLVDEQCRTADP
ncbi:MAG TPA: FAD-dependent oxidoreductase, partial [Acidimicrobiales bacterium]|nr:FAD-dependent oxidoreductase [Acidimicrobiales bacterium]